MNPSPETPEPLTERSIALISYSAPPVVGGVESIVESQARWLSKYGADVTIFAGKGETIQPEIPLEARDYIASDYRPEFSMPDGPFPDDFRSSKKEIRTRLEDDLSGYNTWIVHNILTMPFNMLLTAGLHELIDETSSQVIQWTHDIAWVDNSYDTPSRYPWELLGQSADVDCHVAISDHRKRQLREVYSTGHPPVRVVHDAVEVADILGLDPSMEAFYHRHGLFQDDLIAVYPARLVRRKNFEKALAITSSLLDRGLDMHLLITGPVDPHDDDTYRYREELFNLSHSLGIKENVVFCCREDDPVDGSRLEMSFDRVKQLYRMSDLLLMTSRQEGFGMPVVEAGLTGTVICCSDRPPLPEIAGEHAIYLDIDESNQTIADRIETALENNQLVQSRRRMRNKFSWPALMKNRILPLFEALSHGEADSSPLAVR